MYPHSYIIPNNSNTMYRNASSLQSSSYPYASSSYSSDDDRFFLAPFVVGGLAGTALGFGIANNNQLNRPQCCGWQYMPMPMPYYPQPSQQQFSTFNNTNSFYS